MQYPPTSSSVYGPYLGTRVSLDTLADIGCRIGDLYRRRLSPQPGDRATVQDIHNGHVHIKIIEGAISQLVLEGHDVEQLASAVNLSDVLQEQPSRLGHARAAR